MEQSVDGGWRIAATPDTGMLLVTLNTLTHAGQKINHQGHMLYYISGVKCAITDKQPYAFQMVKILLHETLLTKKLTQIKATDR